MNQLSSYINVYQTQVFFFRTQKIVFQSVIKDALSSLVYSGTITFITYH